MDQIVPAKPNLLVKDEGNGRGKRGLPCFFHCGETNKKKSYNIQDAIILGTKRIGHGF